MHDPPARSCARPHPSSLYATSRPIRLLSSLRPIPSPSTPSPTRHPSPITSHPYSPPITHRPAHPLTHPHPHPHSHPQPGWVSTRRLSATEHSVTSHPHPIPTPSPTLPLTLNLNLALTQALLLEHTRRLVGRDASAIPPLRSSDPVATTYHPDSTMRAAQTLKIAQTPAAAPPAMSGRQHTEGVVVKEGFGGRHRIRWGQDVHLVDRGRCTIVDGC